MKFYAYALGHLLLVITVFSVISQSELIFRAIIDGSLLQLLALAGIGVILMGMGSGFIGAAYSVLRARLLATKIVLAHDESYSPKK